MPVAQTQPVLAFGAAYGETAPTKMSLEELSRHALRSWVSRRNAERGTDLGLLSGDCTCHLNQDRLSQIVSEFSGFCYNLDGRCGT